MRKVKLAKPLLCLVLLVGFSPAASAQTPSSASYQVQESSFTSGSDNDANSASYNARGSAGNLGVGIGESANFQTYAGSITPDEEYVELVVPSTTIDMGVLNPGTAATGSVSFTARAYLNDNYVIISSRESPTLEGGSETIDPITTAAAFDANAEQFGMNLVANTAPVAQGANPAPQPNASFAYGEAAPGYNTADNYQYNAGDIIARSVTRGYGETSYTISYLMNVIPTTPAGVYTMEQDLVILATF